MLDAPSLAVVPEDVRRALSTAANLDTIGMTADDPMSEAGRKALLFYFARMLKYESAVTVPGHEDAVHDMRVATRRLRSVLKLFKDFYHKGAIRPFRKTLGKIAGALGDVRDLEVFKLNADDYTDTHPEYDLGPLLHTWGGQLDRAREGLNALLHSERYQDFVVDFAEFVTEPGAGAIAGQISTEDIPFPYRVRHVIPHLIYEHYGVVRAYETVLPNVPLDTLHSLRIESKRLRYTLETFEEVTGAKTKEVISGVKNLQDHLGNLQDSRVASMLIRDFIGHAGESESLAGVLGYLADREQIKQTLRSSVPQVWETFTRPTLRKALASAIAEL
jgi:CHAD domain-containing protein